MLDPSSDLGSLWQLFLPLAIPRLLCRGTGDPFPDLLARSTLRRNGPQVIAKRSGDTRASHCVSGCVRGGVSGDPAAAWN